MTGRDAEATIAYPRFDEAGLKRNRRWAVPTANTARVLMRLVTRIETTGGEQLNHGPFIIAPFHASKIDPLVIAMAMWKHGVIPHFLAKSSLFTGALGHALVRMGQIPVLRASAKAGDSLVHAKSALAAGQTVIIYPQGTLTKDPELWPQPAKTGVARLAVETGIPVIPVGHWGLDAVMPVHSSRITPRPFGTVRVRFGEPIAPPAPDAHGTASAQLARRFSDRVTAGIAAEVAQLRGVALPDRFAADLAAWDDAPPRTPHGAAQDTGEDAAHDARQDEETR